MTRTQAKPPHRMPFCERPALLKGLGITLAVNALIAVILWWLGTGPLDEQMVYSQGIGLSIWALINGGARGLSRPTDPGGFPVGWRAVLLVPGGVLLGVAMGTTVGGWYAGHTQNLMVTHSPRMAWTLLGMSLIVGSAMTLYFYLAGKSTYLQSELERTQRQTAEAQLKLLESQLEPHMLFNTLANLRVLISIDPPRAQTMLDHLIAYLRATLAASRHTTGGGNHTLATEFDRLNDYLALMAIRMGPRLRVTLDLPDDLRHHPIPPLLLQPLVENAIQHGLEPQVAGGHILVRANQTDTPQGPALRLEVTDDGAGTAATLPSVTSTPAQTTGFGTTQVRERLATAYGDRATFDLIAFEPNGTSAVVHIYH
ncbi:MAG TPA: histidine kinase [Burkholderiaceae bacterium]|nr:histidine kinase [Burkholderiaceae bacterium]